MLPFPTVLTVAIVLARIAAKPVNNSPQNLLNSCVQHFPDVVTFSPWRCQVGKRGPCDEGQIFRPIPSRANFKWIDVSTNCPLERPDDCEDVDVEETFDRQKPLADVQAEHGVCLWATARHPCRGFPSGFRFNAEEFRCQLADDFDNPSCKKGFTFYSLNDTHGECKCQENYGIWPTDGKCYKTHSQGPCGRNEWMIRGSDGEVSCQSIKCQIDDNELRWPTESGISCKANQEMTDKFESILQYSFECFHNSPDSPVLDDDTNFECNQMQADVRDSVVFCYREEHGPTSFFLTCPQVYV